MNRYVAYSGGIHVLLALLLILLVAPAAKGPNATYTIDFIGSGKVVATTGQEAKSPAPVKAPPAEVKPPVIKDTASAVEEQKAKPAPKAYQAKTEITAKKQPKKAQKKAEAPLAAPSILDDAQEGDSEEKTAASKEGQFEGGNIQTDFANFPYPWYITQVRNSMWIEWEKRRPVGVTMSALVSFAIARDGKIKNMRVEKSSGDDTFDFAASSAVINAGPFAPLPMYYEKDELTVTVEFKQEK